MANSAWHGKSLIPEQRLVRLEEGDSVAAAGVAPDVAVENGNGQEDLPLQ